MTRCAASPASQGGEGLSVVGWERRAVSHRTASGKRRWRPAKSPSPRRERVMSEILTPEQFDDQLQNIRWHANREDEMAASAEGLVRRHEHALRAERDRLAAEVERLRVALAEAPTPAREEGQ